MPVQVDVYKCPLCENVYDDEEDARGCAKDCICLHFSMPEKGYVCRRCGELYFSEAFAAYHEERCGHSWADNDDCWFSCEMCNHMTAEGMRRSPCPLLHKAPSRKACEHFELAVK